MTAKRSAVMKVFKAGVKDVISTGIDCGLLQGCVAQEKTGI